MVVLSLFDGIGTGYLALKDAGVKIDKYYASEIDERVIRIAKKNNHDIIEIGDVRNVDIDKLGKIDLLIGGSPCQGFSRNGKHENFSDSRSGLLFEFVRIKKEIQRKNSELLFMLENVRMKKEWQERISKELETEAIIINSAIHTQQARERTYWSNIKGITIPECEDISIREIAENRDTSKWRTWKGIRIDPEITEDEMRLLDVVDGELRVKQATKTGYIVANEGDGINLSFPKSKTRRGRVIRGKIATLDCQCNVCFYLDGAVRKVTIIECERLQCLPDGYTEGLTDTERKKSNWERMEQKNGSAHF